MGEIAFLWVEGVDFESTLYDTSDLSTVRGASIALAALGEFVEHRLIAVGGVEVERLFSGASQAAFRISGVSQEGIEQAVAGALGVLSGQRQHAVEDSQAPVNWRDGLRSAPYEHLSVVHGLRFATTTEEDALRSAQAAARAQQQRRISVPPFTPEAIQFCTFDGRRPADEQLMIGGEQVAVSQTVKRRRAFGRRQRQAFYREQLGNHQLPAGLQDNAAFADSFEDIVANPPAGVSRSARGRIAVLYVDGNAFGVHAQSWAAKGVGPIEGLRLFAEHVDALHRGRILPAAIAAVGSGREDRIRLETLLWGGDEFVFVCPAWKALDLATAVMTAVASAEPSPAGKRLTYSAGLVIANHKTPIQSLVVAAESLAQSCKELGRDTNQIAIDVQEGIEVPAGGLLANRARLLKIGLAEARECYRLSGETLSATVSRLRTIGSAIPASQLHRWVRLCQDTGLFNPATSPAPLEKALLDYEARVGASDIAATLELAGGVCEWPLSWDLLLAKTLRDYVSPPEEARA